MQDAQCAFGNWCWIRLYGQLIVGIFKGNGIYINTQIWTQKGGGFVNRVNIWIELIFGQVFELHKSPTNFSGKKSVLSSLTNFKKHASLFLPELITRLFEKFNRKLLFTILSSCKCIMYLGFDCFRYLIFETGLKTSRLLFLCCLSSKNCALFLRWWGFYNLKRGIN